MEKEINKKKYKGSNILNFIILGIIIFSIIYIYILWSKLDSSYMPSFISPTKIRILHYYSSFGLGNIIKRFLFDLLIFIFIYPSIYLIRILLSRKFNLFISIRFFYIISFSILIALNLIYCISGIKCIISNSILGYIDYFIININYEIYLPISILFIIEIFNNKLINNKE